MQRDRARRDAPRHERGCSAGHLARDGRDPRVPLGGPIPDPAAETEIIRQLVQQGFKVIDEARWRELRYDWAERLKDNEAAAALARQAGADLLITGEAFSQAAGNTMGFVSCRARVEVRGIVAETAEIVFADACDASGADVSEAVAAKRVLQNAAREMGGRVRDALGRYSTSATPVQIVAGVFPDLATADRFVQVLQGLEGVAEVEQEEFSEGMLRLEVRGADISAATLGRAIETDPTFKAFRLRVRSVNKTSVQADVRH
ncbi:MAG: hypothetical protein KBD01_05735 [Acidobacteria bacterium]|nr:hypothetical protein [Acidobacteriota bacterium]